MEELSDAPTSMELGRGTGCDFDFQFFFNWDGMYYDND